MSATRAQDAAAAAAVPKHPDVGPVVECRMCGGARSRTRAKTGTRVERSRCMTCSRPAASDMALDRRPHALLRLNATLSD